VKSLAAPAFWDLYCALPEEIRVLAEKNYQLWRSNPRHPSLQFKPIGKGFWSARIGAHYRALGRFEDGDTFIWIWIGTHADYNRF
jgi:hypothetical protein